MEIIVFFWANLSIINSDFHSINATKRHSGQQKSKDVVIGNNVWLGTNVSICKGVHIGNIAIVANGVVVFEDIKENTIVRGNPAVYCKTMYMNSKKTTIDDCKLIDLRKINDPRGNLTPIEGGVDVPFDIKRVYYLYDVPGGESRGAHAHKELYQLIVAANGSFTVTLDDGTEKKSFNLNRSYYGLLVVPGIWRDLDDFSSGAVLLCLASEHYDSVDYIRDYESFLNYKKK